MVFSLVKIRSFLSHGYSCVKTCSVGGWHLVVYSWNFVAILA